MLRWRGAVLRTGILAAFAAALACGGDDGDDGGTGPSRSICFTVSGFNVNVTNMWASGAAYSTNVQGLAGFNETISQNGETHTLVWTNIVNNYSTFTVTSFSVTIDGRAYGYPANRCT